MEGPRWSRCRWQTRLLACCGDAAAASSAANAEGRVRARGISASQAATRLKLSAVATSRCRSRVFTNPRARERRRCPLRVPWGIGPAMPARRAYTGLKGSVCCRARAAWRTVAGSGSRRRRARGAVAARVQSARLAQAAPTGLLQAIRTVAGPCRSGRSIHTTLRCPCGQRACLASPSSIHWAAAKPLAACPCQLWAVAPGPSRSLPCAVRLVRRWSEVT